MAEKKRKKKTKTEGITIRLDPKMRFALEFTARMRGQTITKVVERAVMEVADNETITKENGNYEYKENWRNYWNVNEGIRFLNMTRDPDTHPTFEDEEWLEFIDMHREYFYNGANPNKANLEVLWPRMPEIMETWEDTKATDRKVVRIKMCSILDNAGIEPPEEILPF